MKRLLVPALAAALLVAVAAGPVEAKPDLPFCVGYEACHEINGWAIFCVKYKQSWICGECESCGNEPWLP